MRNIFVLLTISLFLFACASAPPKPNEAQPKTVDINGKSVEFKGEYWVKRNDLILFVNGDPIMKGSFPPMTPTLNLKATHEGINYSSHCYFGSVLASKRSAIGLISGAIQNATGKAGDKCEMKVDGKIVEHLYF